MADDKPRFQPANRRQLSLLPMDLEASIPAEHRVRGIWAFIERLNLSEFYDAIQAREHQAGRPPIDPKILLCLWLYALAEGVGSARLIAKKCESDDAYRWICGGVGVNHHALSDFRVDHGEKLDGLLTQMLAVLMNEGLVRLQRIAQDGTRVRASAGAASFRRKASLESCLAEAREHVAQLRRELESDGHASSRRERAARERAAREREEAVARALEQMPKLEQSREAALKVNRQKVSKRSELRVSTTDPDARVMKMADGGFRPAFNVQLAADCESDFIVGVAVTNQGSDAGAVVPMLDQLHERIGSTPKELLVDGGYTQRASIDVATERGVVVYAPVKKSRTPGVDPYVRKKKDSAAMAAWRRRMLGDEAKSIYRERAATIERVNADLKTHRGLGRLTVRGLGKVKAAVLWAVLAYNIVGYLAAHAA